ncbi:MAG: DUF1799 domain-containing protein [Thiomicrospira sp.]|nr:DUF1799 domain-containing protein [Thiomicrospira sp.]
MLETTLEAFELFMKCRHQMHYVSTGMAVIPTGLNYNAVDVVLTRLYAHTDQQALFERLLIIEDEYLAINAEDRD